MMARGPEPAVAGSRLHPAACDTAVCRDRAASISADFRGGCTAVVPSVPPGLLAHAGGPAVGVEIGIYVGANRECLSSSPSAARLPAPVKPPRFVIQSRHEGQAVHQQRRPGDPGGSGRRQQRTGHFPARSAGRLLVPRARLLRLPRGPARPGRRRRRSRQHPRGGPPSPPGIRACARAELSLYPCAASATCASPAASRRAPRASATTARSQSGRRSPTNRTVEFAAPGGTMFEAYEELAGELAQLSNYHQKYARIIRDHGFVLRQRLNETGSPGRVHLAQGPQLPSRNVGRDPRGAGRTGAANVPWARTAFQVLHLHALETTPSAVTPRRRSRPPRCTVLRSRLGCGSSCAT